MSATSHKQRHVAKCWGGEHFLVTPFTFPVKDKNGKYFDFEVIEMLLIKKDPRI